MSGRDDAGADGLDDTGADTAADDALVERLRRIAAQVDPPPPAVVAAARAALTTRRLDAELAELVLDSALDAEIAGMLGQETAVVRAEHSDTRLLSFESAGVAVELQVDDADDGRVAIRGLVSGAAGPVTLEIGTERRSAELVDGGWFTVDGVPPGPLRLHLTSDQGRSVTSAWVSV